MKCVSERWDYGWLMKTCHDAHIRCMVNHSPAFFESAPHVNVFSRPVSTGEANEIFDRMDERFRQWTGMTLAEHLHRASGQEGSSK